MERINSKTLAILLPIPIFCTVILFLLYISSPNKFFNESIRKNYDQFILQQVNKNLSAYKKTFGKYPSTQEGLNSLTCSQNQTFDYCIFVDLYNSNGEKLHYKLINDQEYTLSFKEIKLPQENIFKTKKATNVAFLDNSN